MDVLTPPAAGKSWQNHKTDSTGHRLPSLTSYARYCSLYSGTAAEKLSDIFADTPTFFLLGNRKKRKHICAGNYTEC